MNEVAAPARIVLIAGPVKERDRRGHHDYLGGCRLLAQLLARTPGVEPVVVADGWPEDAALLDGAAALVFYDKGGGRQGFLATPERVRRLEQAAAGGAGLIMIHQTVGFPDAHRALGTRLLGGVYASGVSRRGHWRSRHSGFPDHPVTRGVEAWRIRDGWLNGIAFRQGLDGITPLLWSGRRAGGSPAGGEQDIVAWAFDRPDGGRSFVFTGLDAHSAWAHAGLRRLVVNGILWSAGAAIPAGGAPVETDATALDACLTPRRSPLAALPGKLLHKLAAGRRW